jgi:hypothetical protein
MNSISECVVKGIDIALSRQCERTMMANHCVLGNRQFFFLEDGDRLTYRELLSLDSRVSKWYAMLNQIHYFTIYLRAN